MENEFRHPLIVNIGVFKSSHYLLILLTIIMRSDAFDLQQVEFPIDQQEAECMLKADELESLFWNSIQPFYHRPLQVPDGELVYLHEVFPAFIEHLPVKPEILNRYIPWDIHSIKQFLSDYPYAAKCLPILAFNYNEQRQMGRCSFFVQPGDTNNQHTIRYTIFPVNNLKIHSTMIIYGAGIQFKKNIVKWKPSRNVSIKVGNTLLFNDNGLFLGVFPHDTLYSTATSKSFRPRVGKQWNGISATVVIKKKQGYKCSVTPFFHIRSMENIGGVQMHVGLHRNVIGEFGIFRLDPRIINRQWNYTGKLHFSYLKHSTTFICGGSREKKYSCAAPFIWRNVFRWSERRVDATITRIPAFYDNAYSLIGQRFRNEFSTFTSIPYPVTLFQIQCYSKKKSLICMYPKANIWFLGKWLDHAEIRLNGKKQTDKGTITFFASSEYSTSLKIHSHSKRSRIGVSVHRIFNNNATVEGESVVGFTNTLLKYYRGIFTSCIQVCSGCIVKSNVSFVLYPGKRPEFVFGLQYKQTFFNVMESGFKIEKKMYDAGKNGEYHIVGAAVFVF